MDSSQTASLRGEPVDDSVCRQLVDALVAATCTALGEMAATEAILQKAVLTTCLQLRGDFAAVIRLQSQAEKVLVLDFPRPTATALTARILDGVATVIDDGLLRDCVGEIANVIAGQAKALLADTPYQLSFSIPEVIVGGPAALALASSAGCHIIEFATDIGGFSVQIAW